MSNEFSTREDTMKTCASIAQFVTEDLLNVSESDYKQTIL